MRIRYLENAKGYLRNAETCNNDEIKVSSCSKCVEQALRYVLEEPDMIDESNKGLRCSNDLELLIRVIETKHKQFNKFRYRMNVLTLCYPVSKYPGDEIYELTHEEVDESLEIAREIYEMVKEI